MSQKLCAKNYKLRPTAVRLSLLGALVAAAVALGNISCEDKGIGRSCDVLTDASQSQGVFNSEALECPSRICLKPVLDQSKTELTPPTGAYCSASCSQDSDCNDGQLRDSTNAADRRCKAGFVCGIPFVKGRLCCQKLCLCKDFLSTSGAEVPNGCLNGQAEKCTQVSE
jgi:hypothetical protein